jgi:hypothetical protein
MGQGVEAPAFILPLAALSPSARPFALPRPDPLSPLPTTLAYLSHNTR